MYKGRTVNTITMSILLVRCQEGGLWVIWGGWKRVRYALLDQNLPHKFLQFCDTIPLG